MIEIIKEMAKLLSKEQSRFSGLEQLIQYDDGSIVMVHIAHHPKRSIRIEFKNNQEALEYIKSL